MDISLLSVWWEIYTVTLPLQLLRKFKFNQLFLPPKFGMPLGQEERGTAEEENGLFGSA